MSQTQITINCNLLKFIAGVKYGKNKDDIQGVGLCITFGQFFLWYWT